MTNGVNMMQREWWKTMNVKYCGILKYSTQKDLELQGSHYRARDYWCPAWNGVNRQPEEIVTGVGRTWHPRPREVARGQ